MPRSETYDHDSKVKTVEVGPDLGIHPEMRTKGAADCVTPLEVGGGSEDHGWVLTRIVPGVGKRVLVRSWTLT